MNKLHSISELMMDKIPEFIFSLAVIIGFILARSITKKIITTIFQHKSIESKNHIALFAGRVIRTFIWITTIISLLGIWGIDVNSIIAGLGLTSFVIGFALKDVLSSAVAGILILFHQPFKIKSKISVLNVEGVVTDIDMRYITLKDGESTHLIPNSRLASEKVTILKK